MLMLTTFWYEGGASPATASADPSWNELMVAAVDKFPYAVYDAGGKMVASGEVDGSTDELPPGDYKVVVKAGTRDLIAPRVTIGLGQTVALKISVRNGQLVLE